MGTGHVDAKGLPGFEVVSIRPGKPGGELAFGSTANGFSAHSTPLFWLVLDAYSPLPMAFWRKDQVQGAPAWVRDAGFDVEARVDAATEKEFVHLSEAEREARLRPMLQAMLVERCEMAVHQVTREGPVFALTVQRGGARLRRSGADEVLPAGIPISGGGVMVPIREEGTRNALRLVHTSMAALAEVLSGLETGDQPPIVDRTGLAGVYDFVLRKREEDAVQGGSKREAAAPDPATRWDVESLGLALKRARGDLPGIVVDRMERPSEN